MKNFSFRMSKRGIRRTFFLFVSMMFFLSSISPSIAIASTSPAVEDDVYISEGALVETEQEGTVMESEAEWDTLSEEERLEFDPLPTTMEEVQAWIVRYIDSGFDGNERPNWEADVNEQLIPAGWRTNFVEGGDEYFGADYYTIFQEDEIELEEQLLEAEQNNDMEATSEEMEEEAFEFAPQPTTREEVQESIDAYQTSNYDPSAMVTADKTALPENATSSDLQTAINNAASGDVIEISNNMDFSSAVTIPVGKEITIQSDSSNQWTLTQSTNNARHFTVNGKLVLQNIILDGVNVENLGGGVQVNSGGTLTIGDGAVIQNCTSTDGGGVLNSGTLTIESNGKIINNRSVDSDTTKGGGIYSSGASAVVTIHGMVAGNESVGGDGVGAGGGRGGGIFNGSGSTLTIKSGSVIENNKVTGTYARGGGIYNFSGTYNGTTELIIESGITISGNSSSYVGGGISNQQDWGTATTDIGSGAVISGNTAPYGGGIFNDSGTVNINGTVNGNTAGVGGGIFNQVGAIYIGTDGEISENKAESVEGYDSTGGGIYSIEGEIFISGIISGNTAGFGAGIMKYTSMVSIENDGKISGNEAENDGGGVYLFGESALIMNGGAVSDNKAVNGSGGGIYVTGDSSVNITGTPFITGNSAGISGGGIYTEDPEYMNLSTDERTVFSGNTAGAAFNPPENARDLYPNILFGSTSIANHPLNNYDINFEGEEALTFHVTYHANGGTGSYIGPDINPNKIDIVLSLEDTGISHIGHSFTGWNTEPNGSGISYAPGDEIILRDNVTLYAQWQINEYTVTFDSAGGTPVDSQIVKHGEMLEEPEAPTKEGYTFAGWHTNTDISAFDISARASERKWDFENDTVTSDMTLYAKWTESKELVDPVDPTDPKESTKPTDSTDSTGAAKPTESTKSTGQTGQSSPQTGDDSNMLLWTNALLGSLAMMGALSWGAIRKKRKNC